MTEKWKPTSREVAYNLGPVPQKPKKLPPERMMVQPERGLKEKQVINLTTTEIFELLQFLNRTRVNLNQKALNEGNITPNYAKVIIQLEDGRIGVRTNSYDVLITGTLEEFKSVLKPYENL